MPSSQNNAASQAGPSRSSRRNQDNTQPMDVDGEGNGSRSQHSQAREAVKSQFQGAHEKRELRKEYRSMLAAADNARREITDQTSESLTSMIEQADRAFDKVKAPSEGILDARLLGHMVDIGTHMARTLKTNVDAFDTDSFLNRVARTMGGQARAAGRRGANEMDDEEAASMANEWDWDALGRVAAKYSRRAVTLDFLNGPLQVQPKERKKVERTKKVKEKVGVAVRPEQLKQDDIQRSENETTVMVRQLAKLLEKAGKVHLFDFVINPQSFSNTVENLFYLSFLVRDGRAELSYDEETYEPHIMLVHAPSDEDYQQGVEKRQLVLEFDMKIYKDIVETYGITESIIPHRAEVKQEGGAGRWYG
ncbi:hypothetical protein V8E36_001784 [Tilletia maclaganii]